MKQALPDYSAMYTGIDTKFIRIFLDLFKIQQAAILGYVSSFSISGFIFF
jgi:hypothetical protein